MPLHILPGAPFHLRKLFDVMARALGGPCFHGHSNRLVNAGSPVSKYRADE